MKKKEILNRVRIDRMDDVTVFIQNKHFNFSYTKPESIVKDEFIGQYRYFGGLQCDYDPDSIEYKNLENWLCDLAEKVLNI